MPQTLRHFLLDDFDEQIVAKNFEIESKVILIFQLLNNHNT